MRYTTYSEKEKNIVKNGITAIQKVLMGTDSDAKLSLLFCLDRYLDPYFGYKLPYEKEIYDLLETVIISPNILSVKEDAIDLLTSYGGGPFPVLEKNFDMIEEILKPDVRYAINLHKENQLISALLKKCLDIFDDSQKTYETIPQINNSITGEFPKTAIVIYNIEGTTEFDSYFTNAIDGKWITENGKWKVDINQSNDSCIKGIIYNMETSSSRRLFKKGIFCFSIYLDKEEANLLYQFGPKWGRCISYKLSLKDQKSILGEAETIWVV